MILSKKKRDDALKRIAAISIIIIESVHDIESIEPVFDNLTEIAFDVGGIGGLAKVRNTMDKWFEAERKIDGTD